MKFDIKNVQVLDIEGKQISLNDPAKQELISLMLSKRLGKFIYENTNALELAMISQSLYKESVAEVSKAELETILFLVKAETCPFSVAEKIALITYIETILNPE